MAKVKIKRVSLKKLSKEREKRKHIGTGDGGLLSRKMIVSK